MRPDAKNGDEGLLSLPHAGTRRISRIANRQFRGSSTHRSDAPMTRSVGPCSAPSIRPWASVKREEPHKGALVKLTLVAICMLAVPTVVFSQDTSKWPTKYWKYSSPRVEIQQTGQAARKQSPECGDAPD